MDDLEAALRRALDEPAELPELSEHAAEARLLDVAYTVEDSPLGPLLLASTPRGLIRVAYLHEQRSLEEVLAELAARVSPRVLSAPARLDDTRRELDEFFAGRRRDFDVSLDWKLITTPFARRVLRATSRIPFGAVLSYKEVAGEAGNPRASRAAGNALGSNPIPIIVPCHRVTATGGGLGGYTGGLDKKRALLSLEGVLLV